MKKLLILLVLLFSLIPSVSATDATINATTYTTPHYNEETPVMVWTNNTTGYKFYRAVGASEGVVYAKTVDSGVTWSTSKPVTASTGLIISVWYDRWTPGDTTGNLIHIAYGESSSDDFFYKTLDTINADTLGAATVVNNTLSHVSGNTGGETLTITKSSSDVLFISYGVDTSDTSGYNNVMTCSATCTTGSNWHPTTNNPYGATSRLAYPISLMPLGNSGNVILLMDDIVNYDILSKVYYPANNSWDANWVTIDANAVDSTTYTWTMMPTIDQSTGDIYLAYGADVATATASIRTATYSNATRAWTAKSDVVTNVNTITSLDVIYDQVEDTIYTIYLKGVAGSNTGVYWKNSTDGMTTWSSEVGTINSTTGDLQYVRGNIMVNGTPIRRGYITFLQNTGTNDGIFGTIVFNATGTGIPSVGDFMPPVPTSLTDTTGNFWVKHDWSAGAGNVTDSYNVSQNGTWFNGSSNTINKTTYPHGWSNVTIYAYNSSGNGTLNNTPISMNTQVPNNIPSVTNVNALYSISEGQTLNIDANYLDADYYDIGTFADNATQWNINTNTGVVSWPTVDGDQGTYYWNISFTDNNSATGYYNFSVIVLNSTPSVITNLASNTGNFWINWTWTGGANDNDYNVWINNTNTTSSSNLYYNGTYSAHATRTISVRGHNATLNTFSNWVNQTTTIPNNVPVQNAIGNKVVNVSNTLTITITSTDADSDTLSYSTNATKGSLVGNVFTYTPVLADVGVYTWYFTTSDLYGGSDTETITVTVNNPLVINSYTPVDLNPTSEYLSSQGFSVTLNKNANVDWYIDGTIYKSEVGISTSSYSNSSALMAVHNVTVIGNSGVDQVSNTWLWNVTAKIMTPVIIDTINNITSSNLTLTINTGQTVNFTAIANQTISTWTWYGVDNKTGNGNSITTGKKKFNEPGEFGVEVKGFNAKGYTQKITWIVTVNSVPVTITGTITDANGGAPLSDVVVKASNLNATTNALGQYILGTLDYGKNYEFTFTKLNYNIKKFEVLIDNSTTKIVDTTLSTNPNLVLSLSGYVNDSNNSYINLASISYMGYTAYSNASGYYQINVPEGFIPITFGASGYNPKIVNTNLHSNTSNYNATLYPEVRYANGFEGLFMIVGLAVAFYVRRRV